jgi:hypothetical protein
MRSDLVFGAVANVSNRYLLSQLASKAARKLHRSGTRMQDTTNDVLVRFSCANPIGCEPALREGLEARLRPIMTRPVIPNQSKAVTKPLARETSNLFANRSLSIDNSLTTTLGFHTYSDIRVS